jgi:hypothetical protein
MKDELSELQEWNDMLQAKHTALLYAAREVVAAFPREINEDGVSFNVPAYLIKNLAKASGLK